MLLLRRFVIFFLLSCLSAAQTKPALDAATDKAILQGFAGEIGLTDKVGVIYSRVVSAPGRPHVKGELWRWASVTKQLTATLALQQVAIGKLSLDDTLALRLPDFKGPTASRITIRMLLQHTSGLPNPDGTPAASPNDFPAFYLRQGPVAGGISDATGYCAGKPKGAPGDAFNYNNCDYIVLAAVLQRLTGKTFAQLLQDQIAAPLALASLRVAEPGNSEPATVKGFVDGSKAESPFHLANFSASGAAYGTLTDLLAFDRALLNNKLLDSDTTRLAWKGDPKLGYVALGVWSYTAKLSGCSGEVPLVERRGEIGGIEVRNLLAPSLGRALVVFADRSDLDFGEIWRAEGLSFLLASAAFCH